MRRFPSSPRHRLIARNPDVVSGDDDLSTWANTAQLTTMALPGATFDFFPLVVDVTKAISAGALADTGGLRFQHSSGVRFAHKRTATRVLLIGNFHGGVNTFSYYWGKSGATQPGIGTPTANEALAGYRVALIFEGSAPLDMSPTPATFTTVGTPTYDSYALGQSLKCADGSYIETTAAKLRSNARNLRAVFASITLPSATEGGRIIAWANWTTDQRAFQLWVRNDGLELYTSANGTSFQRWTLLGSQRAGPNCIGASWKAGEEQAILLCNEVAETKSPDFSYTPYAALFDSTEPYVVGGTKIAGSFFTGTIRALFELSSGFLSENHFHVWRSAWEENDVFWNLADRTPASIDVPDVTGAPLSSEVAFARKEVTGITAGTAVAVYGDGNPTYSIGSSFTLPADIKAKGNTPGEVGPGNWLASYHTASSANATVRESFVTVGTVTSPRRSTTVAATGGPPPPTPGGPATYTVNSISAFMTAFNAAKGGDIIEFTAGDYKSQGTLNLQNRSFIGGDPLYIRASTLPYRGYLAAQGGLVVADETFLTTGSGGAEFERMYFRNLHNIVFQGLRVYQGDVGTGGAKTHTVDCIGCTYLTFENWKFCGFRPTTSKKLWAADKYRPNGGWYNQGRAIQMGISSQCTNMTFRKCLFHYFGDIALYCANTKNTLLEDCVFSDQMSDHMRTDGPNENFTARRCIFYRTWARKAEAGGVAHSDACQNSAKDQPGWKNHYFEYCIFVPGDNAYPHIQCVFMEHDNYPTQPRGSGVYLTNCLFEGRAPNTIYNRPGDKLIVTKSMILQNQFGGLNELNEDGNDSLIDTTFNTPSIFVSSTTGNGHSLGNNIIDRSVYWGQDFNTGLGDQILNSTLFTKTSYAAELFDYPLYTGTIRAQGVPVPVMSGAAWRPCLLLNSSYVLSATELKRMAPKSNAAIHPNQKGQHHGCSELFQSLGALP